MSAVALDIENLTDEELAEVLVQRRREVDALNKTAKQRGVSVTINKDKDAVVRRYRAVVRAELNRAAATTRYDKATADFDSALETYLRSVGADSVPAELRQELDEARAAIESPAAEPDEG